MNSLLEFISNIVWGAPTLFLLFFTGVFYTVKLRFFQFRKIKLWSDNTLFSLISHRKKDIINGDVSPFQAVSTALASTVGTGNIVGVSSAIALGGAGAVFWMWISAVFSMMTAYSENTLGIYYRIKKADNSYRGGAMYYIRDGLSEKGLSEKIAPLLSNAYCIFLIGASLGIGCMTQANTISVSAEDFASVPKAATALFLCILTAFIISGGVRRILKITSALVPFMAIFYITACLTIILSSADNIPIIFKAILKSAFSFKAVSGASGGIALKECISVGLRRGIFSNEAGLGASVTVSSCSNVTEPAKQGMWGIFQVFVDTIIICSLTAFAILSTSVEAVDISTALSKNQPCYVYIGEEGFSEEKVMLMGEKKNSLIYIDSNGNINHSDKKTYTNIMQLSFASDGSASLSEIDGISLVSLAFRQRFGKISSAILCLAVTMFAFSTIIGWYFYGERGAEFLRGRKAILCFRGIYIAAVFIGSISEFDSVWIFSDIFNGLLALTNLSALLPLSNKVSDITQRYLKKQKTLHKSSAP